MRRRSYVIGLLVMSLVGALIPLAAVAQQPPPSLPGVISNGTVVLGVNPEGHLIRNFPPDPPAGFQDFGLKFVPTGGDGLTDGCDCEGWGVADVTAGVSGWATVHNISPGLSPNLELLLFESSASTAISVVNIADSLTVSHIFRPSPVTPLLFEIVVTVTNVGIEPADVVYRRVMDWDIPPTPFNEFVTIGGSSPQLIRSNNDGRGSPDPLVDPSITPIAHPFVHGPFADLGPVGDGPHDHGAMFDFSLGVVNPGASESMVLFYGAAATEADALAALADVGAEVYSLGQPSDPGGPDLGIPNTFMFGFCGEISECEKTVLDRLLQGLSPLFGSVGDPVNTFTGNWFQQETDIGFPAAVFGLDWRRAYNSTEDLSTELGRGWTYSHAVRVTGVGEGGVVGMVLADGRHVDFVPNGTGGYGRPMAFYGELIADIDGSFSVELFDGQSWDFDLSGRLVEMENWDGQMVTIGYGPNGPTQIVTGSGYSVNVSYDTAGLISQVAASDGRVVAYGHDSAGRLTSVTDSAGGVTTYSYNAAGLLESVTDPEGVVIASSSYDSQGRVVLQSFPGGQTASFAYDPQTLVTSVTFQPSGEVFVYQHNSQGLLVGSPTRMATKSIWLVDRTGS